MPLFLFGEFFLQKPSTAVVSLKVIYFFDHPPLTYKPRGFFEAPLTVLPLLIFCIGIGGSYIKIKKMHNIFLCISIFLLELFL